MDDHDIVDVDNIEFRQDSGFDIGASKFALDPDEQGGTIQPKMVYRMMRMIAIDRHHIMQLFREVVGLKEFSFDDILKDTAENFGVPYEKLRDVNFEGYA